MIWSRGKKTHVRCGGTLVRGGRMKAPMFGEVQIDKRMERKTDKKARRNLKRRRKEEESFESFDRFRIFYMYI